MKCKVDCGELSLEFNSVRIATYNERPPLKHGQIHLQKRLPHLRGLFNKSPAERHAKREFCASSNKDEFNDL